MLVCLQECRKISKTFSTAETGRNREKTSVQKNTNNFMQALRGALLFITAKQNTGLTKLFQSSREFVCMLKGESHSKKRIFFVKADKNLALSSSTHQGFSL